MAADYGYFPAGAKPPDPSEPAPLVAQPAWGFFVTGVLAGTLAALLLLKK